MAWDFRRATGRAGRIGVLRRPLRLGSPREPPSPTGAPSNGSYAEPRGGSGGSMWSGGDDWNDRGERVRLYQPNLYARNKPLDASGSFVGGSPVEPEPEDAAAAPRCSLCQTPLYLLVHLVAPQQIEAVRALRCLEVFACNTAACTTSLLRGTPLCHGGGGVVVCRRRNATGAANSHVVPTPAPPATDWTATGATMDDNDWSVTPGGGDDPAMDDLERKLAAMEASAQRDTKPAPPKDAADVQATPRGDGRPHAFPSFPLTSQLEPAAPRLPGAAADEDDVGMSVGSDDKIQAMLARYLAEEEDEAILSALRGSSSSGVTGAGGRERDERLPAAERALLAYTDRLKRAPRQVLRYAYGGVPLWSIPEAKPEHPGNQKSKKKATETRAAVQEVPPCACGAPRVFEFQLLPSLLHVLEVDRYAAEASNAGGDNGRSLTSLEAAYAQSGMNFGNVAVYTCSRGCEASEAEYVVVQGSVDDAPLQRRTVATDDNEPVVIAEGTQFDDDDDDDDAEVSGSDNEENDELDDDDFEEMDENDKRV